MSYHVNNNNHRSSIFAIVGSLHPLECRRRHSQQPISDTFFCPPSILLLNTTHVQLGASNIHCSNEKSKLVSNIVHCAVCRWEEIEFNNDKNELWKYRIHPFILHSLFTAIALELDWVRLVWKCRDGAQTTRCVCAQHWAIYAAVFRREKSAFE